MVRRLGARVGQSARALGAAILAAASLAPQAATAAPDSLLGAYGDPLRMLHMYSAADGSTHIDEITLPLSDDAGGITKTMFFGRAENVRLHTYKNGYNSPWRYARSEHARGSGHVVLLVQGDLVITIAEGRSVRVPAGTLMLNDDHAGRGHQTKCENAAGRDCVIMQIDLDDAFAKLLPPVRK